MKKRYMLVFSILIIFFATISVSAGPPFFYRWATNPGGNCIINFLMTGTRNFEYDTPASGTQVIRYRYLNGVLQGVTNNWFTGSGTGTQTFGPYGQSYSGYPVNFEDRFDTVINGTVVYRSRLFTSCSSDGPATTSIVSEIVSLPPAGSGILSSSPAVDPGPPPFNPGDGRINLHSQAPVVAYKDPLAIYAVNPVDSTGQLILTVSDDDLEEQGIPEGDGLLLAATTNPFNNLPVSLYRTPDGGFQLAAFYIDGKPYIIWWDTNGENLTIIQW